MNPRRSFRSSSAHRVAALSPRRGAALLASLIVAAALSACRRDREAPGSLPPIVLVSIDTLRSDRLPVYGYAEVDTPAIDALARDAVVFERAYSHVPLTLPSHASLFTGRLPYEHGVRDNAGYRLGDALPTLAGLLRDAGYRTGGAVSSFVLRGETGVARGFESWDDELDLGGGDLGEVERAGSATLHAALPWLRSAAADGAPFLFFLHVFEPHAPYRPPEPFASRFGSGYDAEVAAADAVVGELLDELRRLEVYDSAVVVLLSDHGEGLGDHGEQEHGVLLYREAIQVPLLVKLPRAAAAGSRRAEPIQLADLLPTLLDVSGVAPPAGLPGAVVVRRDGTALTVPARKLYAETAYPRLHYGWSELFSLIDDRWHIVEGERVELYDLLDDPHETMDLALAAVGPDLAAPSADLAASRGALEALRADLAARPRQLAAPEVEDEETRARLVALGYLASASGAAAKQGSGDPRSKLAELARLERAASSRAAGDLRGAVDELRPLLADEPAMVDGWEELSRAHEAAGELELALAARRRALEASNGAPEHALAIAALLLELGRFDEAALHARLGVAAFPAAAANLEARIALATGDLAVAEAAARRAVEARAGRVTPLLTLAEILLARGDAEAALAAAQEARAAASPGSVPDPRAPLLESRALRALGRDAEADAAERVVLERAAALARTSSTAPLAHTTAIELHLDRDDLPAALEAAERALDLGIGLGELRARIALALLAGGDAPRALALLERAPAPRDLPSRHAHALALTESGRHDAARRELTALLEGEGDLAEVRESLGLVELRLERPAAALPHLERAVALEPQRANAWNLLAVARWQGRRDGSGAVDAFARALELEPERWDTLFNLGMVAADAGLAAEARTALDRFVREAPPERYGDDIRAAAARLERLGV